MQRFLTSPELIDLIIVFTLIEALGLIAWRRHVSSWRPVALMVLPGIFLLLATRAALAGAAWPWLPMALAGALVAHLLDVGSRWRD